MSIENIQSEHLTDAVDLANTVSRKSIENLAFITVESNKNHVTTKDEKVGSGKWIRERKEEV